MEKQFIFEHQDSTDKIQNEMTDKLEKPLREYTWCSHGEPLRKSSGFKHQATLLRSGKLEIFSCTSSDLENAIIIGIIRDLRTRDVYDGPLAEESCLIFDSDSVYLIQKHITAWGSRISYGWGKVVFAQSLRPVFDEAGIDTCQFNFCRNAYLNEANGYQDLMKIVYTRAETFFTLNSAEKKPGRMHPGKHVAIGVVGGFKHGLSSVINAVLGAEVLPVDILPTTSAVIRVTYGSTSRVCLSMKDGTQKEISVENLLDYVTGLNPDSLRRAMNVEEAVVYYPCPFCRHSVDIIDMPGLNNNDRMDSVTLERISKLDAVVMVLVPDSPFSVSEADFLLDVLLQHIGMNRIVFAINKMDKYEDQNNIQKRIVEGVREQIKKSVIQFVKDCERCLNKNIPKRSLEEILTNINVLPVSAQEKLEGQQNSDQELLVKSGITELESALKLIVQEIIET